MAVPSSVNRCRIDWDLKQHHPKLFNAYWDRRRSHVPKELFSSERVWLEIGAGSGNFIIEVAARFPSVQFVAVERSKERSRTLRRRSERTALPNLKAYRGNAVPVLTSVIPDGTVERVFVLYPCPWPKASQRKNRWYLHPVFPHFLRILRPGGLVVWASDERFYIDEARYVCEDRLGMRVLSHGDLRPNEWNLLEDFPGGRSKFENAFLAAGKTCHELIVQKDEQT